jgi:hypothetical protein
LAATLLSLVLALTEPALGVISTFAAFAGRAANPAVVTARAVAIRMLRLLSDFIGP